MAQRSGSALNVMVATPAGGVGQGGIDRVMAALKHELERHKRQDVETRFLATRGTGHIAFAFLHLAAFCLAMIASRVQARVDVVHINLSGHGSTYRKLVIARLCQALEIAYVLHLHSSDYMNFWSDRNTFLNRRIRCMFIRAAAIVVLGRSWRNFVAARVPEAQDRIVIVPNATEVPALARSGRDDDSVHIVFLGRLEARKGVPQLCAALATLNELPAWRATIAGDGEAEETRALIKQLGLAQRVELPGWQGSEDVARLLSGADILALPSFAENLPMSVIEAMAAGVTVVATPVGAVEDIVTDGENGLLVPAGDIQALATALRRLIVDPDLRARLGKAGLAVHRQRLDVGPFADKLIAVWSDAADRHRLARKD